MSEVRAKNEAHAPVEVKAKREERATHGARKEHPLTFRFDVEQY